MSDFSIIECGYDAANETINFGSRPSAEANLQEAVTLATLKCSEEAEEENETSPAPQISTVVNSGKIFFSVNNSIRIFSDNNCTEILLNLKFNSRVGTFSVSSNGQYLLLGLEEGSIHLFSHISNHCDQYSVIFQQALPDEDSIEKGCISSYVEQEENDQPTTFIILSRSGNVYRLTIHSSSEIDLKRVFSFDFMVETSNFINPLLIAHGSKAAALHVKKEYVIHIPTTKFRRLSMISDNKFLGLGFNGKFKTICSRSFVEFPLITEEAYRDMILLSEPHRTKQILAVTEKNELGESFIQSLSFPGFTLLFSLKVATEIQLIYPEGYHDEVLFVSKIYNERNCIRELRVHKILETDPNSRLQRLLNKRNFEEAEEFAKLFDLDDSMIRKAKAQLIVDQSICTSEDIAKLLELLDTIDDNDFKVKACLDVECSCSAITDVRNVLNYGCKLESGCLIEELLFRFDTFYSLVQTKESNMLDWQTFSKSDLLDLLQVYLNTNCIEEAKIIYSRLDEATRKSLSENKILEILATLNCLPLTVSLPFVQILIPTTLNILPPSLDLFVKWTCETVYSLESQGGEFCKCAMDFTKNILGLIKRNTIENNARELFHEEMTYNLYRDKLKELNRLLSALNWLQILQSKCGISLPLKYFLSGPHNAAKTLLNFHTPLDTLTRVITDFLLKYMHENQLEPDEIFSQAIIDALKYDDKYWIETIGVAVNYITSVELKLNCVRKILNACRVPWCAAANALAINSTNHFHPLVSTIKRMIEDEPAQVILRSPKYQIRDRTLNTLEDLRFVVNRIIYCKEDDMVSDILKICRSPEQKHEAKMLLIKHFIRTEKYCEISTLFDNSFTGEIVSLCQELVVSIEDSVNNHRSFGNFKERYYGISSVIFARLMAYANSPFERRCIENDFERIQGVYNLKKDLNIETSSGALNKLPEKQKILAKFFNVHVESVEAFSQDSKTILMMCHRLAKYLSMKRGDVVIKLCERVQDFNAVYSAACHIFEIEASSPNLCLMTVMLMKCMGKVETGQKFDIDSSYFPMQSTSDCEIIYKGLELCAKMSAKAFVAANADELSSCIEVQNWVHATFYCTRHLNTLENLFVEQPVELSTVAPGFITFTMLNSVFDLFLNFSGLLYNSNPHLKYFAYFISKETILEDDLKKKIEQLPEIVECLCYQGQHLTALTMMRTLQNSLLSTDVDRNLLIAVCNIVKTQCVPRILQALLNDNEIDVDLICNLLFTSGKEDVSDVTQFVQDNFKKYRRQPQKFVAFAQIGVKVWDRYGRTAGKNIFTNVIVTMKWWNKLSKEKVDYEDFFRTSAQKRIQILINLGLLDSNLFHEYCTDYELDLDDHSKLWLRTILCNWKPLYEIVHDLTGKATVIMKNSEKDLLRKCSQAMERMKKEDVYKLLRSLWGSINFYYYEVFSTVLSILSGIEQTLVGCRKAEILSFLKTYQRVGKPAESEIELWNTTFPGNLTMDPLSEFRVPYVQPLFTNKIWEIILPEVNLRTYKEWFRAADIVGDCLKRDDICIYSVKEIVTNGILSKSSNTTEWNMHPQFSDLLVEVDLCIGAMSDPERATSVAYHLLNNTPNGADQVTVAKICHKYATAYKVEYLDSSSVGKSFLKIETRFYQCSALHILHEHKLAEEKYITLIHDPKSLIVNLYSDPRIVTSLDFCPDINKATSSLARLFELEIKDIQTAVVNDWLAYNCADSDPTCNISHSAEANINSNDNILRRVAYICSNAEVKPFWTIYLLKMGLDDSSRSNVASRVRALKVFDMISNTAAVEASTNFTYQEFRNFVNKLNIVSNLGTNVNVETLDVWNKKELLTRLAGSGLKRQNIKAMASICITYKMDSSNYWRFIIEHAVQLSMFCELKQYLGHLKSYKYHSKNFYVDGWQKLIDHNFTLCRTIIDEKVLEEELINTFIMIQACPVLYSLKFHDAFKMCLEMNRAEFASVLLQYFEDPVRNTLVKEILNSGKCDNLMEKLTYLEERGIWGMPCVMRSISGC